MSMPVNEAINKMEGKVRATYLRRGLSALADPVRLLTARFRIQSLVWTVFFVLYAGFTVYLFFAWVNPSLDGHTDQHIAADSATYIHLASVLQGKTFDPTVVPLLLKFPNTLLGPTLVAYVVESTPFTMLADYAIFLLAVLLLRKSINFSVFGFVGLLLINATTTISLVSVNKEIIDLLVVAIFIFGLKKRYYSLVLFSFLLAIFNRYEVALVLLLFLLFTSKLNPLRQKRALMLTLLTLALSISLPIFASNALNEQFEMATNGHTIALLDSLEMHFLYIFAVIPKIAENLFAEIINFQKLQAYLDFQDIANTYIVFFNNLATLIVVAYLCIKRTFSIKNDLVYLALIGWIVMAIALIVQPRYFYLSYILLCLRATQKDVAESRVILGEPAGLPKREEAALA
jgi:hypothetical protein